MPSGKDVDGQDKPGHDARGSKAPARLPYLSMSGLQLSWRRAGDSGLNEGSMSR
jgi:hypothetical protein